MPWLPRPSQPNRRAGACSRRMQSPRRCHGYTHPRQDPYNAKSPLGEAGFLYFTFAWQTFHVRSTFHLANGQISLRGAGALLAHFTCPKGQISPIDLPGRSITISTSSRCGGRRSRNTNRNQSSYRRGSRSARGSYRRQSGADTHRGRPPRRSCRSFGCVPSRQG